jgi:hypothetical protein
MPRFFNTTGPCDPRMHYMVPPGRRLPDVRTLVEREQYFVLHAPRQVGKTTAMRAFAAELREAGRVAVHATLETSQDAETVAEAEPRWIAAIARYAEVLPVADRPPLPATAALNFPVGGRFAGWLGLWAASVAPRRVVLMLDEVDTITGAPMVNFLRQLRDGFNQRPDRFPASIALIGMRDLLDYLTQSKDGVPLSPGSPFNIKAESITMRNFLAEEVAELLAQHAADTGQVFLPEASERLYWWTAGQPFLVNAIALICMDKLVPDRSRPVTAAHIDEAKERLVLARTTHLHALGERLKEARVAPIVQSVILGDEPVDYGHDDFRYVTDLGLLVKRPDGAEPANRMYREVLVREIGYNQQENMKSPWWPWLLPDGRLDFPALVEAFRQHWRENADVITEHLPQYPEAVCHIAYMSFLHRVVNGGGTVEREFAAGRGAVDVVASYQGERFVTEIKRVRKRDSLATAGARPVRTAAPAAERDPELHDEPGLDRGVRRRAPRHREHRSVHELVLDVRHFLGGRVLPVGHALRGGEPHLLSIPSRAPATMALGALSAFTLPPARHPAPSNTPAPPARARSTVSPAPGPRPLPRA